MRKMILISAALVALAAILLAAAQMGGQWKIHDRNRPAPPVITAGEPSTQDHVGAPPSDAVVLFDGKDLSKWKAADGGPAKWKVGDGYFEVAPGTGDMYSKAAFGDSQVHVEWATPNPPRGQDQDRGNSGVFLMGLYELQVLDSYHSATYPDGQAGAIYGQYPPLVNACRPPGEWQTYDIVFHGPRFHQDGKVARPAFITVLHNGVLVQDQAQIMGPTEHMRRPPYHVTPDKLPIRLQDHNHPVRYRNIWIRELSPVPSSEGAAG